MDVIHLVGDMDIVKYLITEANCDPNFVSKYGQTCLHFASKYGKLDVVEYLTDKHHCVSKMDVWGDTPLPLLLSLCVSGHMHMQQGGK